MASQNAQLGSHPERAETASNEDRSKFRSNVERPPRATRRGVFVPVLCHHCNEIFTAPRGEVARGRYRFCSRQCFSGHARDVGLFAGANNPRWLGGVSNDNMRYKRRTEAKYPERAAARRMVNSAIRAGRLEVLPCEVCGCYDSQAHHDDYSKPLDVRWLCRHHHDEHHAKERAA